MKMFSTISQSSYEADGWESLLQQLEANVVGEARKIYGLEKWEAPSVQSVETCALESWIGEPGQALTGEQVVILQMEKQLFPRMRRLVSSMPFNEDTFNRVVDVVESFRDVLASVHREPAYRAYLEEQGRHAIAELLDEERTPRVTISKEDPERDRLEKIIAVNKHKNGKTNWKQVGKAAHMSDVGARKKAKRLGLSR